MSVCHWNSRKAKHDTCLFACESPGERAYWIILLFSGLSQSLANSDSAGMFSETSAIVWEVEGNSLFYLL